MPVYDVRSNVRETVDPLFLKLREELMGSGVSYGVLQQSVLPVTVVVTEGGGTTKGGTDISGLGYIKGLVTLSGSTAIGTDQKQLSFINATVTSSGSRTTVTIPSINLPLTTAGDLLYYNGGLQRRAIGTTDQVLVVSGGLPVWKTLPASIVDPTTTLGDILYRDASQLTRLPIGANGYVLTVVSGGPAWQSITVSGGGGAASSTGTVGSESGTPAAGDLYFPSNGFVIERYNGSAWEQWGPIWKLAPPNDASFAWVNQGSATIITTNGGVTLKDPARGDNNASYKIRKLSAPGTPYTRTAMIKPNFLQQNYTNCGVCFRESSSGKLHLFRLVFNNGWLLTSTSANSATSDNADYISYGITYVPNIIWLRLADNGTNRIVSFSLDGYNFITFHTVSRTDFLTADEIGWFVDARNTLFDAYATLLSWS